MENSVGPKSNFLLPGKRELTQAINSLSKREWFLFAGLVLILVGSALAILQMLNRSFMASVPIEGGGISEGIIGTPRFVNPVLAFTDTDRDVATLVYSGLMRRNTDGSLVPDLAEKYEVSPDGLIYTFTLKNEIFFHDGKPITVDDIVFTVSAVKDPVIKSPRKGNWDGVEVTKTNERTVVFSLKQPYASFLENATLGIIPAHIWNTSSPIELNEANTNPTGSGPYRVNSFVKNGGGTISSYELSAFKKFALGKPYVKNITLRFYQNEDELMSAVEKGEVDQAGSLSPANAEKLKEKKFRVKSSALPRVFGLFFNQNQNQIFLDKSVIRAINKAVDKDRIINDVLLGFGRAINTPIPPNMTGYQNLTNTEDRSREEILEEIRNDLSKAGWTAGESGYLEKTETVNKKKTVRTLEFSISTSNAPELSKAAELVRQDLSALGMKVEVKTFDIGNLNQSVIRPRKYDALLFGEIIQNDTDLYAFWHSSQRLDPGLNVALYTNTTVDKLLEEAFVTTDPLERAKKYAQFESEIDKDMPAVFLYSPDFIYVVDDKVQGLSIAKIISPASRFWNANSWYIKTDNVWKIFSPDFSSGSRSEASGQSN